MCVHVVAAEGKGLKGKLNIVKSLSLSLSLFSGGDYAISVVSFITEAVANALPNYPFSNI
jgi:ABC-type thiamine transport system substrate-binding protein